jgi:hypothetical protein
MLEVDSVIETATASAALQAEDNWKRNLPALGKTQNALAASLTQINPQVEWIFARDGSLTALVNGKWWGGCSVPSKAAQELLKTLQITAPVACFLAPSHPAQIAFALRRLKSEQAITALLPRLEDLVLALHCHDFSDDISSHRLWFTAGEQWPAQMVQLFRQYPGLAIPQQFIRTALLSDDASAPLIATAQKIFTDELNHRSSTLSRLRETRLPPKVGNRKRISFAAPMRFRLWDDAGGVVHEIIQHDSDFDWTVINFDDPVHASPLALANAAAESDAIFATNLTRADCPHFLNPEIPLVSWLTTRPIPLFDTAGPHDLLFLPDSRSIELARRAGWAISRLAVASWPTIAEPIQSDELTIIADTGPIESNPNFDLSSHQLLWDLIRSELQGNPTLVKNDICTYLHSRMKRLNVTDHGLDQRRFIEELIIPSYQQSIAAHLLNSNLSLRMFGHGWCEIPTFALRPHSPLAKRSSPSHRHRRTARPPPHLSRPKRPDRRLSPGGRRQTHQAFAASGRCNRHDLDRAHAPRCSWLIELAMGMANCC